MIARSPLWYDANRGGPPARRLSRLWAESGVGRSQWTPRRLSLSGASRRRKLPTPPWTPTTQSPSTPSLSRGSARLRSSPRRPVRSLHRRRRTVVGVKPEFTPIEKPPGIRIRDPIENAQLELYTDRVIDPEPADTERFVLPVDDAVTVRAQEIEIPRLVNVFLWSEDGTLVDETSNQQHAEYPRKRYSLDVDIGAMKLQIVVDASVTIRRLENSTHVAFDGPVTAAVGARSLHESPAGTITVGDDVEDAMRALSLSGSALKTTSPSARSRRCAATPARRTRRRLRRAGRPHETRHRRHHRDSARLRRPLPGEFAGVLPRRRHRAGRPAGARGGRGASRTRHRTGFESEVNTLLKHVFFLDCVTRTEGSIR